MTKKNKVTNSVIMDFSNLVCSEDWKQSIQNDSHVSFILPDVTCKPDIAYKFRVWSTFLTFPKFEHSALALFCDVTRPVLVFFDL